MADYSPLDFNRVVQTVAGEGANQPPEAQRAIASTILNRHAIQGGSLSDIAGNPKVYNGANTANAKSAGLGSPLYDAIAANISSVFTDGPTTKATHFHARMDKPPAWDDGSGEKIGDQVFLDRSDTLKGPGSAPSADQLEKHFAAPPVVPVEQQQLPQVPGYIEDPANPSHGIPIGGPSADELEAHFGGGKPPPKPLSPQQQAAGADAGQFEQALSGIGSLLFRGEPTIKGVPNHAGPDLATPAAQGMLQGFGDEAKGKAFAGATGVRNVVLNALGKPIPYGMKDAEAAETGAARKTLAGIHEAHPVLATAAETGGAVAPWVAGGEAFGGGKAVVEAPSALGKLVQYASRIGAGAVKGSALGAAGGAVTGFGNAEGEASDRLPGAGEGAAGGAVLGGLIGGAVPAAAPVASRVAGYLGKEASALGGAIKQGATNALDGLTGKPVETTAKEFFAAKSPTVQRVKGALAPADVAETVEPTEHETRLAQTRVMQMMQAKGMHPDELRAIPTDIPHTTAEAIGSQTVNHLASLARRAGTTPDVAGSQMAQRAEDFAPSVMDDFAAAARVDPRQARVLNEEVTGTIHKDEVTPAYKAALDVHNPKPVMTPALAKLQQDPDIQSAIGQASRLVAKTGRSPTMPGPKINPDTGATVIDPVTQQPVIEHHPTPETWDMAKKLVDKMIVRQHGVVVDSGPDGVKNVFLKHASQDVRDALKKAIPGYDKALASASDELSRKAAYKRGAKTLFDNSAAKDFADARGKMTPDELEAHTAGVANALFDKAQRNLLTPAKLKTPLFQAKVREVLGDRADMFLGRAMQRARLHATGGRIMPGAGSQTTPLLQAGQETAPVVDALGNIVKEAAHLKASPLTFALKHGLKTAIGDKAANISETPGYRNAYGRLLLQHPRVTADELREAPPIKPRIMAPVRPHVSALGGYVGGQARQ